MHCSSHQVSPLYFRFSNSKHNFVISLKDTFSILLCLASQQAALNFTNISRTKKKTNKKFQPNSNILASSKADKDCKIVALNIMPPNVFLQVKKINRDKNIVSFLTNKILLTIKFVCFLFFNFCLEFEKLTTQACCIYLVFLTIKSYQN